MRYAQYGKINDREDLSQAFFLKNLAWKNGIHVYAYYGVVQVSSPFVYFAVIIYLAMIGKG